MTLPDSSNIFAKSKLCSLLQQNSSQIWTNSEYEIEFIGNSRSLNFIFSNCEIFSIFLASFTVIFPIVSAGSNAVAVDGAGGARRSNLILSPVTFIDFNFSLNFSPTGIDKNSGSLATWLISLLWRNRRKKSPLTESGGVAGMWERSRTVRGGSGSIFRVLDKRFAKIRRIAIDDFVQWRVGRKNGKLVMGWVGSEERGFI